MSAPAAPVTPVTRHPSLVTDGGSPSVHRIQEPDSGLYIRFTCTLAPSPKCEGVIPHPSSLIPPRVKATLTRRDRASRFVTHAAAAECFARYLPGQPLDIVRCDA
jgi:hypothetical protein